MFVLLSSLRAIPHNSKCRYGERGAADAKPKAQIILDVLSSILATQMPCRSCRSGACRKAGIVRCCLGYLLTKQKRAAPPSSGCRTPLCKSKISFVLFMLLSRNQNGVRSFCTADPVVLAPCLDCSDYSILPKFCKHFCQPQGIFCRRSPYFIKLFLRFFISHPRFCFLFFVKLSFGLNNFKITAFPPHHWVMPGSGRPSPAALFRCFSPPYVVTALFIESFLCQFLMSSKIPHCFLLYRSTALYRMFVLFCAGFFRHFPILYIL